jgi:flagellar export protein FliJ
MAKFEYKFQSIQHVKEMQKKRAQKDLSIIEMEIEKCRNEYDNLQKMEDESKRDMPLKGITVADIKFRKGYELCISQKREVILKKIDELLAKKEIKMAELVKKSKEHKIFDTLKESYLEKFNKKQNKLELNQIDEIATQKYVRYNK